jgi:tRNA dimethylallyltransferase
MIDPRRYRRAHRRLGMKGNAAPCFLQHEQVVGAVADRKRVLDCDAELGRAFDQNIPLRLRPQDRFPYRAGQTAVRQERVVGVGAGEAEGLGYRVRKEVEAARNQDGAGAVGDHRPHQRARARHIADAGANARKLVFRHALEQGHALAQGGGEIDLAIHGPTRDFGHAVAFAAQIGHLIEHLVFNDRRFHVGDQEVLTTAFGFLGDDIDRNWTEMGCDRLMDGLIGGFCRRPGPKNIAGRGGEPVRFSDSRSQIFQCEDCQIRGRCHDIAGLRCRDQGEDAVRHAGLMFLRGRERKARHGKYRGVTEPDPLERILVVAGPTASGKSALAMALAREFDGVVINADSMQIYRDLPILTAQPDEVARAQAPHRLYGVIDAATACSAGAWRAMAVEEIAAARREGKQPILVGGTGLYLRALLEGLAPVPKVPLAVRQAAREARQSLGATAFHGKLAAIDPESAGKLNPNDTQRVLRAYEVAMATGRTLGDWHRDQGRGAQFSARAVILLPPRADLYAACDARFLGMMERGVAQEVEALLRRNLNPELPAMRALGMKALSDWLQGRSGFEQAIAASQQETRNYAKRQMTWFRKSALEGQDTGNMLVLGKYSESFLPKIFSFIRLFLLTGKS